MECETAAAKKKQESNRYLQCLLLLVTRSFQI